MSTPSGTQFVEAARRELDPGECALIVIDIQEKLLPPIFERERVVKNSQLLIRAAAILNIPTIATTQYAKGLGGTVSEVKSLLPDEPIDKQMFSCFGSDAFCAALKGAPNLSPNLRALGRRNTLLLCGMESHICVAQTALAALAKDILSTLLRTRLARARNGTGKLASTACALLEP